MPWRDAWRILVIILRPRAGMLTRLEPNCPAGQGDGKATNGVACALPHDRPASTLGRAKPGPGQINGTAIRERYSTRDQATVITPVESDPWAALSNLILEVGGLIELSSWSIRNGVEPPPAATDGTAPAPPS